MPDKVKESFPAIKNNELNNSVAQVFSWENENDFPTSLSNSYQISPINDQLADRECHFWVQVQYHEIFIIFATDVHFYFQIGDRNVAGVSSSR